MLIGRMLSDTRGRSSQQVALWFGDRSWTYADLDDATDRLAAGLLRAGVRAGDRVALFFPNCPELVLSYFACFKIGAITVPLNYRYREAEARYAIEHSGATTLIAHPCLLAREPGADCKEIGLTGIAPAFASVDAGGNIGARFSRSSTFIRCAHGSQH